MEQKINCPICGAGGCGFYAEKNSCRLNFCPACGLIFVCPIPSPDDLETIYQEHYFKKDKGQNGFGYVDYDQDKEPMRSVFIKCLTEIENLSAGRKIFDVGAATGYFLNLAFKRGWRTAGSEISGYAAAQARAAGHQIFCGPLPEMVVAEKFDVITMWDVLEHVDSAAAYLQAANKLLADNGWLVVNTIDAGSLWAKLWGKHWQLMVPPEHLFYYSNKNLKILFEQSGFKIIKTKKLGKKFSLAYIFKILANWQNIKFWIFLANYFSHPLWRKWRIPINLRDNIYLLAIKIKDI